MSKLSVFASGALVAVLIAAALLFGPLRTGMPETPAAPILLFDGDGASPNDVKAIEALLRREKLPYSTADSHDLDAMAPAELSRLTLIIFPGGNFEVMGKALDQDTPSRIRAAVRGGVNYLGICAGAFFAGDSPYNAINLTGRRFGFYAESAKGVRKQTVHLASGDTSFATYWEDGPELSGWGEPLAKYPDGTPAVVQGKVGAGWVVLTGVHLEAPPHWYEGLRPGQPEISNDYAIKLIHAALGGTALPYL